jgi:hypothetical protein
VCHGDGDGGGAGLLRGREVVGGREGDDRSGDDGELHFENGCEDINLKLRKLKVGGGEYTKPGVVVIKECGISGRE